jgi:hypothetical protein
MDMKVTMLDATTQKSYYGKALVKECEDGTIILQSYQTDVAKIENGNLIKLWDGYSLTTMNHINDFCRQFGFPTFNKKSWLAFGEPTDVHYKVKFNNGFVEWGGSQLFDNYDDAEEFAESIMERWNNGSGFYISGWVEEV